MRKEKKYNYIYKTTSLKDEKFYIGMHSTDDLSDGYLGSGDRLRRSIRRNGKENFKIEYLEFFDSRIELANRERELVNEDLLKDSLCMNLKIGGSGGYINPESVKKGGKTAGNIHANKLKTDNEYVEKHKNRFIGMVKGCFRTGKLTAPNWTGKKHREESKIKIGKANSQKQKAAGNSQFGTCWITNGIENKKIKKTEKLPKGWKFGRKIKVI